MNSPLDVTGAFGSSGAAITREPHVRPAILFGGDGVLVNNIAWLLRKLPVFGVGGKGDERLRGPTVRSRALIVPAPPRLIPLLAGPIGLVLRDMRPAVRPPATQSLR